MIFKMNLPDRPLPKIYRTVPSKARKVHEGKIFSVWEWDVIMFDGSNEIFEMIKRPDTVVNIVVIGDKFLLLHEEQPEGTKRFDFSMGRVNENEKILDAAYRELSEETGIIPESFYYIDSEQPEWKIDWFIHFFIAKDIDRKIEKKLDNGERITDELITFEELLSLVKETKIELPKELLKDVLKGKEELLRDKLINPGNYFKKIKLNYTT